MLHTISFITKVKNMPLALYVKVQNNVSKVLREHKRIKPTVTLEALLCEENNEVHRSNDCSPAVMLDR